MNGVFDPISSASWTEKKDERGRKARKLGRVREKNLGVGARKKAGHHQDPLIFKKKSPVKKQRQAGNHLTSYPFIKWIPRRGY